MAMGGRSLDASPDWDATHASLRMARAGLSTQPAARPSYAEFRRDLSALVSDGEGVDAAALFLTGGWAAPASPALDRGALETARGQFDAGEVEVLFSLPRGDATVHAAGGISSESADDSSWDDSNVDAGDGADAWESSSRPPPDAFATPSGGDETALLDRDAVDDVISQSQAPAQQKRAGFAPEDNGDRTHVRSSDSSEEALLQRCALTLTLTRCQSVQKRAQSLLRRCAVTGLRPAMASTACPWRFLTRQ